jgi:23S rRNA pseudouridine1911/1915/1917 synthase
LATPLTLLHEDDRLVVVAKPPRLLSVPTPGADGPALPAVLARQGLDVLPIHRLDREVSGAILFAKDEETRELLDAQLRDRAIEKTYWAMAQGRVKPRDGAFHFPILEEGAWARVSARGKKSTTRYRTLEPLPAATIVEIDLVTGRHNQIRIHFAHAGFPLVGERKYARGSESPIRAPSRRIALHAWRLAFVHPYSGVRIEVEAPLPPDLVQLVAVATARASKEPSKSRAPRRPTRPDL